ncbi:MAG: penicillin-binding protein activator LpoB [Candidatus Cloacimonetes bacterium]|nr:penicillin-binding protein activator LpoB [Candidatus Cloacimonadota bacterium]
MKKLTIILVSIMALLLIASCGPQGPQVTRIDAGTQTDLSGFWNDTDVRIVTTALINDFLNSPRVNQAIEAMGGRTPIVLVGRFSNESSEQINTAIISSTFETVIFNTGRLDFVAGGSARDQLRAERQDQQSHASEQTAAALANEAGADFMLFGTVRSQVDRAGNQTVRTYIVDAEITSVETNQRIWMGRNDEIKKVVVQPRNRL